jgi:hypothetical protein
VFFTVIVHLLNRKVPPTFCINKQNDKQLRYSIELSFDSSRGYLLIIDEFKWIKFYYDHNGKTSNIAKVRDAISEAIDACVTILSYNESALGHKYLPPCFEQDKGHPVTEILLDEGEATCECNREVQKLHINQLYWLSKDQPTCSSSILSSDCQEAVDTDSSSVHNSNSGRNFAVKLSQKDLKSTPLITDQPTTILGKRKSSSEYSTHSHEAVDIDNSSTIHFSGGRLDIIMRKVPELRHLTEVLTPIQDRYESLGVQLCVDQEKIEGIRRNNDANDVKLKNILTQWMKNRNPPVTWKTIIDIVGRNPIKNIAVKQDILDFLNIADIFHIYSVKDDFVYEKI